MANLTEEQIEEKVISVLVEILKVQRSEITRSSKIRDDLGAESLDVVTLLLALEDALDVQIEDTEAAGFITVGDTIAFISGKLKG